MAKMLDGPVPDGARSVSWPWYHHVLTNELTTEAKQLLAVYSGIPSTQMEAHVYRIVGWIPFGPTAPANNDDSSETKLGASFRGLAWASSGF